MKIDRIKKRVSDAAQLASLLEVSGYPKPGNVHRTRDFPNTRYEHFLAGSVAMRGVVEEATVAGAKTVEEGRNPSQIEIGEKIERGIASIEDSHLGSNTHLGILLLFIPLAAAGGFILKRDKKIKTGNLREKVDCVMDSTTPEDSAAVSRAIQRVMSFNVEESKKATRKSWLGEIKEKRLSLTKKKIEKNLMEEKVSLFNWLKVSSAWDGIARELTSGMEASFEIGYPYFSNAFNEWNDINVAVVHTFLKILSKYPDTFVARKVGLGKTEDVEEATTKGMVKAEEISSRAGDILKKGGLETEEGIKKLERLDKDLHRERLNPGTTADLTASSIMIALLGGLKY